MHHYTDTTYVLFKEKVTEEANEENANETEKTKIDENSGGSNASTASIIPSKQQISVMDPIDTVFKIVNLAPAGGSSCNLNVPGQPQSSNG